MGAPDNEIPSATEEAVRHVYVHIPFCHHICPYCSFYKHTPGKLANRAFVDALLREIRQRGSGLRPETIYFGGGTPTLLSSRHLERLLGGIGEVFDLSALREWTVEANPATFDLDKARMMRRLGVTRVSLGVQSWSPETLATLGRDHSPDDAERGYTILREAELDAVNIDLMFSVPGESLDRWRETLERTVALTPDHVSAYNLNYEEDTPFFERLESGEFRFDDDANAEFFRAGIEKLTDDGFAHYEISNFARPGYESVHNRAYWMGADYLGIGPSAVSTIAGRRWTNVEDTAAYVAAVDSGAAFETRCENLSADQRRTEAIALQLRTAEGLQRRWIEDSDPESGEHDASAGSAIDALLGDGLVEWQNDRLVLTSAGKPLVDSIAAYLL